MPQPRQFACILVVVFVIAVLSAADAKMPVTFALPRQTETVHVRNTAQGAAHYGYVRETEEVCTRVVHKTSCKRATLEDFVFETAR